MNRSYEFKSVIGEAERLDLSVIFLGEIHLCLRLLQKKKEGLSNLNLRPA